MFGGRPHSTWIWTLLYRPTPENMDSISSSHTFEMCEFFTGQMFTFFSIQISINIVGNDDNGSVDQSQTCSKNSALAQASVGLSILLGFSSQLCFASRILKFRLLEQTKFCQNISKPVYGWKESSVKEIPAHAPHVAVHQCGGQRGRPEQSWRLFFPFNLEPGKLGQQVRLFFVKPKKECARSLD